MRGIVSSRLRELKALLASTSKMASVLDSVHKFLIACIPASHPLI